VFTYLINIVSGLSIDKYVDVLRNAISKKELVIIIGSCSVDYIGRGESKLTDGERIVIIKRDGALLIHRPEGFSPVNWQPDTSLIEVKYVDGKLIIRAIRDNPREQVVIYFNHIDVVIHGKLIDQGEFIMYMDESVMSDILFEHPELIEDGLRIVEKEKPIEGGYIDLFGFDKNNNPVIIELKKVTATREAVLQLYNYVKAYELKTGVKPRGILIAPSFNPTAIEALNKLKLEWKEIDLKKLWSLKKAMEKEKSRSLSILDYIKREVERGE